MPRKAPPIKGKKGWKPVIPIDWNRVDKLLQAGCLTHEIAAVVGCSNDTIRDRCVAEKGEHWTVYSAKMRAHGDSLLREAQYKTALTGDKTMQIWLGKNRLHQRDDVSASDHLSEAKIIFEELAKKSKDLPKSQSNPQESGTASDKVVELTA